MMDFFNTVRRFSFGGNKDVATGLKALKRIQDLLEKTIAKYEGAPHALTPEEIAPIKTICDQLIAANFQLKVPGSLDSRPERPKNVHYQHVYENETFSIGIFILPPGVCIPLHDHPRMSVISRVLYGSMHVRSYDLVKCSASASDKKRTARLCMDKVVVAPCTMELLPDYANLHELIGDDIIGCAFLDIITPPYDPNDGRDCTYFRVVDSADSAMDGSEKLFVLDSYEPHDLDVISEDYHGPHLLR